MGMNVTISNHKDLANKHVSMYTDICWEACENRHYFTYHRYAGEQVRERYLFCERLDSLFEDRSYVGNHLNEDMEGRSDEEIDCLNRAIRTSKILESDCRL